MIYYLVGATAVGKSSVVHYIAKNSNCDILSADSMLVYREMNIGTAKPDHKELASVKYYGVDIVDPDQEFSVGDYVEYASEVITSSEKEGRDLIVTGGSGLYVKGLTSGLDHRHSSNPVNRSYWLKMLEDKGIEAIRHKLESLSPEIYDSVKDKQNPRRLLRALELASDGVKHVEKTWDTSPGIEITGLEMDRDSLNLRIEKRVEHMYSAGLLEEVSSVLEKYGKLSLTATKAIGYAEAISCLNKQCSIDEAKALTVKRTRQLAKRQRTWFRHQEDVNWINITESLTIADVADLVTKKWGRTLK